MKRLCTSLLLLLSVSTISAKDKPQTKLEVGPGPSVISPAEAALAPDPKTASPAAIVLVEERDVDEYMGFDQTLRYHLRAKILTNEGRSLADIEVPYVKGADKIKEWWARTILPDGKVLELPLDQAVRSTAMKFGSTELKTVRAALPGVVPGAVIDYGYVLHGMLDWYSRIDLQRTYPIQKLRLRWHPTNLLSAYSWIYAPGLPVTSAKDNRAIRVEAENLPPFVEEPWMPPEYHIRASATFYYIDPQIDSQHFWDEEAKLLERYLARFLAGGRLIRDTIEGWNLPADMPLPAKLAHAYRWVNENVKDTGLLSFEELSAQQKDDGTEAFTAKQVLREREGTGWQVSALFVGFARALGAEAHLAMATDRRQYVWNPSLLSMHPFQYVLVAVRAPGEGDDKFVLVDPGVGLDYGEVPWWTTGVNAMLSTKSGFKAIPVPASDARKNLSETAATFTFDEEGTMHVAWTRTNKNLRGFDERRHLKELDAHARGERLAELCGRGREMEVGKADSPGLDAKFGSLALQCELDGELVGPTEEIGVYSFVTDGPWTEPLPDFEGRTTRVHHAVFHFGRVDKTRLSVKAPPGFVPKAAPEPRKIESPFGRYARTVAIKDDGYEVERAVAFTPLVVPPEEYATLRSFLDQIRQADQSPLEFERKR